jgi:hypothetical protein
MYVLEKRGLMVKMVMMVIYLPTAVGLTLFGSSTVHIYTQKIHIQHNEQQEHNRTTQLTTEQHI